MNNIICGPFSFDDADQGVDHGQEEDDQEEDDQVGDDGQLVHVKLPKGGGNRDKTWRIREDEALCETWMCVSQDAISDTQQTHDSLLA